MILCSHSLTFDLCRLTFCILTIGRLDKLTAVHCKRQTSTRTSCDGCPELLLISDNISVVIQGVLVMYLSVVIQGVLVMYVIRDISVVIQGV